MSRQNPDPFDTLDDLDNELHGLFARATAHIAPRHDLAASVQQRLARGGSVGPAGVHRAPPIVAALSACLAVALLAGVFAWFGPAGAGRGMVSTPVPASTQTLAPAPTPTRTPTSTPTPDPSPTAVPFTVTSVDLSVNPASITGATCGSLASFTYTAVFHVPAHTAGGTIRFAYTLNNGRSQTTGTVQAGAGETSKTFTFVSSGALPADHTYPGTALVMVTGPDNVVSPPAKPGGTCVAPGPSAPFRVTSVSMEASPTSIAGARCGTSLAVAYTATFHLAPNGPGGTIQFEYTVNNGRGTTLAGISVAPGQTAARFTFRWSGTLPADHTYPQSGGVIVHSPNSVSSPLLGPTGTCS